MGEFKPSKTAAFDHIKETQREFERLSNKLKKFHKRQMKHLQLYKLRDSKGLTEMELLDQEITSQLCRQSYICSTDMLIMLAEQCVVVLKQKETER
tara:strand:+ start:342 stop:629 length:288 start_codon:yes stop_codon:yes gene_type:complete